MLAKWTLTSGCRSQALHPGYRLAQWEIQQVIGEGGFSIVYQAFDHKRNRSVAVKEYFPTSISSRNLNGEVIPRNNFLSAVFNSGQQCFHQEAKILGNMTHSCIPQLFDFFQANNTAYIITTLHRGDNLKKWYQQTPRLITQTWLTAFLYSLLDTVSTVHKKGYLHLDISWDNIQISHQTSPILLDFGSACASLKCNKMNMLILKPGFSPPELYDSSGTETLGPWSDIYSIGALVYTLILGQRPPVSLIRCIEDHYQPLAQKKLQGYPLQFLSAIDCALSINPAMRPQTIEALAEQILTVFPLSIRNHVSALRDI